MNEHLTPHDAVYESILGMAKDFRDGYETTREELEVYTSMYQTMFEELLRVRRTLSKYTDRKALTIKQKLKYKKKMKTLDNLMSACKKMKNLLELTNEDMVDSMLKYMNNPDIEMFFVGEREPTDEELDRIDPEKENDMD